MAIATLDRARAGAEPAPARIAPIIEITQARRDRTERSLKVMGIDAWITETGDRGAPKLVALHGGASDQRVWRANIDGGRVGRSPQDELKAREEQGLQFRGEARALSDEFHVITVDLPGFGRSAHPEEHVSHELYMKFFSELVDRLGIERMHLIGVSMGGTIAAGYALENPERIETLHLVSAYGLVGYELNRIARLCVSNPRVSRAGKDFGLKNEAIGRRGVNLAGRIGGFGNKIPSDVPRPLIDYIRKLNLAFMEWLGDQAGSVMDIMRGRPMRTNFVERLGEFASNGIRQVVLYHDPKDPIVPFRHAEEAARRIDGSLLVEMHGVGHSPHISNPGYVNQMIFYSIHRAEAEREMRAEAAAPRRIGIGSRLLGLLSA